MKVLATKHEQILQYIDELPIGEKISVRQIAKALNVSEGTAYRAIKEAENKGYVSSISIRKTRLVSESNASGAST